MHSGAGEKFTSDASKRLKQDGWGWAISNQLKTA
jgi:hypothetical protein